MKYIYLSFVLILTGCNSGNNEINAIKESNITVYTDNYAGFNKYLNEGKNYFKDNNTTTSFKEVTNKYEKVNFEEIGKQYISDNNIDSKYTDIKAEAIKLSEEKMLQAQKTLEGGGIALKDYAKDAFKKSWEEAAAKAKADKEKGIKSF